MQNGENVAKKERGFWGPALTSLCSEPSANWAWLKQHWAIRAHSASLHRFLLHHPLLHSKPVSQKCFFEFAEIFAESWGEYNTLTQRGDMKGKRKARVCVLLNTWHQWRKNHIILVFLSSLSTPHQFCVSALKFFLHFTSKPFSPKALRIWIQKRMCNFLTTVKPNWFLD